jgi:hypothetical protein
MICSGWRERSDDGDDGRDQPVLLCGGRIKRWRRCGWGCEYALVDLPDAAAAWRRDGFVVLPGYLDGHELETAKRDLAALYPSADEYYAAPSQGCNRVYTGDEFGGIVPFPFPTVALCRVVVHDKLVALAEAIFGTEDVRIYAAELWAKYGGPARYEQEHHRDYLNHTPRFPPATCAGEGWRCSSG